MKTNWIILVVIIIAVLALMIFLVRRNWKDEKEFEREMNADYKKPDEEEPEV